MTRYRTIVADPPWHYERTGLTFTNEGSGQFVGHGLPYASMPHQAIRDLSVKDWADDSAHLFLWTTQRYLHDAHDIARAWGFQPVKVLVWCKPPTGFSMGGTFGNACEFIVFGRRGTGVATGRVNRDWWEWRRTAHSAKPEAFLDIVEQISPGPYLELFARRARFGWDYWGDQSLGTAEMEAA